MNEVILLDVGHGNSTIITHDDRVVVVDAPLREHLVDALRLEGHERVRLAVASHSDADHCGGFIGLLLDPSFVVEEIRINPDATKRRFFWDDLKVAWKDAHDRNGTRLRVELTTEVTEELSEGSLRLEVVYPPPDLALGGVGSVSDGRTVTANAMSAVVRVVLDGEKLVLLAGDMGVAGLKHLTENEVDVSADVLVFPHHGGLPEGAGKSPQLEQFALDLLEAVKPRTVVFSIGRGRYATPRPEIVSSIRRAGRDVHIACTQLSDRCADELLTTSTHLGARYSAGREAGLCCLGSAVLRPGIGLASPMREAHEAAIQFAAKRLCAEPDSG